MDGAAKKEVEEAFGTEEMGTDGWRGELTRKGEGCRREELMARERKGVKPWGREAWPENGEKRVERGGCSPKNGRKRLGFLGILGFFNFFLFFIYGPLFSHCSST